MIDLSLSLFENCKQNGPLVCAHRGVAGGNIPCNTKEAFTVALAQGADIIELDVSKSRDGEYFVFHPGMEKPHLNISMPLRRLSSKTISKLKFCNQDNTPTEYGISKLYDILVFLKGKCYINVDKFGSDVKGISEVIRKAGVENQVIVKTGTSQHLLQQVKTYASDFMFMPMVKKEDKVTEELIKNGVNCIGVEALFTDDKMPICSDEYISKMHEMGKIVWVNSIVYDYKDVIAAGYNDDISLAKAPQLGWGWLIDKGFDIIQTDWPMMLKKYIKEK